VIFSGKKISHELSLINTRAGKEIIFYYETNFNKLSNTNKKLLLNEK